MHRSGYVGDRQGVVVLWGAGTPQPRWVGREDELAVEMFGAFDLVPVEIGPAVLVLAQIGRKAPGREQLAGALGVVGVERRRKRTPSEG